MHFLKIARQRAHDRPGNPSRRERSITSNAAQRDPRLNGARSSRPPLNSLLRLDIVSEVDLHTRSKLEKRIGAWHETLRGEYRSLCRISIALYEPSSDVLSTYVYSSAEPSPLSLYEALLADVPSLREIADTGTSRIVNDLSRFAQSGSKHTRNLLEGGIRSSHTIPIYGESGLFGFLFYNSTEEEFFSPAVLLRLQIYTDLISFVALEETRPIRDD